MSLARDIADLGAVTSKLDTVGGSSGALSNRNLVINGAFTVAQRATSVSSSTTAGYNTVDRFRVNVSGATFNQSQQTVTVGGETGLPTQFTKFLRHECTTGNDNHFIITRIEDVAKFQGNMVLSFYAKGSNPSTLGKLSVKFHQHFGSGGSSDVYTTAQDLTLTGTWQRFTFNVTMASITGKTVGAGNYGSFLIGQDTNASTEAWTLDITGVQLEVGDTATDFEHRSFGDEMSRCQRFFTRFGGTNTFDLVALGGMGSSSTVAQVGCVFPTRMRSTPAVAMTDLALADSVNSQVTVNSVAISSSVSNDQMAWMNFNTSGSITAHRPYYVRVNSNATTGGLKFDAEL